MPLLDVRSGSDFTGEGWILLALEFDSLAACDGCGRGCLRNSLKPAICASSDCGRSAFGGNARWPEAIAQAAAPTAIASRQRIEFQCQQYPALCAPGEI